MRFLGLQYPLRVTPRGIMAQSSDVDQIKSDLLQLLLTNPGERVMLPTFGVPLRELVFEPGDVGLEQLARDMIAKAIAQWEPRVEIKSIEVTASPDVSQLNPLDPGDQAGSVLLISIEFFDPGNISQVESLVMQVPVESGTGRV